MDQSMSLLKEERVWWRFLFRISLVILLFVAGIYMGLFISNKDLIENNILIRARSHFDNIVLMRRWNALYGGVFVEKKEGVESNPYLNNPDIETVDGKIYTKKNPALMTREISEIINRTGHQDSYSFRITSLNPINPNNQPNDFERDALTQFEQGLKELYGKVVTDGRIYFRYIAPLYVEQSCLECHAEQGYEVGDVRGGISVLFDINEIENSLRYNMVVIVVLGFLTIALFLGIVYYMVFGLMRKLHEAQKKLEILSLTDELTQLNNRRSFFNLFEAEFLRCQRYGRPLSCLLLDIDFFKKVNDHHGHQAGDVVLQAVSEGLQSNTRSSDIVARYGGEEFVIVMPEISCEQVMQAGEKIRAYIERLRIPIADGECLQVTVSIGVSCFEADRLSKNSGYNEIIQYADEAMYQAKSSGRNRVVLYCKENKSAD